jgi:hypothetical protein
MYHELLRKRFQECLSWDSDVAPEGFAIVLLVLPILLVGLLIGFALGVRSRLRRLRIFGQRDKLKADRSKRI